MSGRQAVNMNDSETPSKSKDRDAFIRCVSWEITGVRGKKCFRRAMRTETRFQWTAEVNGRRGNGDRLRRLLVQEAWLRREEET